MPRMHIYVPKYLHAQMQQYDAQWSHVACRAFADAVVIYKLGEDYVAKLVILTLEYSEAKALLKAAQNEARPEFMPSNELREATRKLMQEVLRANPLERKNS